jgi:hypothetical protein
LVWYVMQNWDINFFVKADDDELFILDESTNYI